MLSLSEAVRVIDNTGEPSGQNALLRQLGFESTPLPLDTDSCERLGFPACVESARIGAGLGVLRALVLTLEPAADIRATVSAIARNLARRVPHLIWLVLAVVRERQPVAIATWQHGASAPRIFSLLTRRGDVLESDAESLCALSACSSGVGGDGGDVMRHLRWVDVLGREAVTRRFFSALQRQVQVLAASLPIEIPVADAHEIALLTTSRLLFLSFLETRGWLNGDFAFLANGFTDCIAAAGGFHRRVLMPLFFGTLNTRASKRAERARAFGKVPFLNGGLFARSSLERTHAGNYFSDDALGSVFGELLVRYRFTARENAHGWSEVAVDPEMLGKAFECLMAAPVRKNTGAFYTPQSLVERLTTLTLASALQRACGGRDLAERLVGGEVAEAVDPTRVLARLSSLRLLDPACGSGAFLVHALERIADLRASFGDARPRATIRRAVLTQSIFGVDVSSTAVWLCQLRLWLSVVIDGDQQDPMRMLPLPNLDRQIRVGDSLGLSAFDSADKRPHATHAAYATGGATAVLRKRYSRATGRRKAALARALDRLERDHALAAIDRRLVGANAARRELVALARSPDLFRKRSAPDPSLRAELVRVRLTVRALRRQRTAIVRGAALPFAFDVHFAEVAQLGGFNLIVGNPPWVRIHNISPDARAAYRAIFQTYRSAAWRGGADASRAGTGFAGQVDLASLFVERAHQLLADDGTLGFLLPSKLWRSLAGGGVRDLLLCNTRIAALEDCSEAPALFDAAAYPSILVANRADATDSTPDAPIAAAVHKRDGMVRWRQRQSRLGVDTTAGSPWLLVPDAIRGAFDRLAAAGIPFAESRFGRPLLGVKSGCNSAFIVTRTVASGDLAGFADGSAIAGIAAVPAVAAVTASGRTGLVETALLRPLVRGDTLRPWRISALGEHIVWPYDAHGKLLPRLPEHAAAWLKPWRKQLQSRSDSSSAQPWWMLFRTETADAAVPRVLWADFGKCLRAAVLPAGDSAIPLNTCYAVRCPGLEDANALTTLLNSPLVSAWLSLVAEPARGGYKRYLGWTMAMLPLPRDWNRARGLLAPLCVNALAGSIPSEYELQCAVLDAYRIRSGSVLPLLEWVGCDA